MSTSFVLVVIVVWFWNSGESVLIYSSGRLVSCLWTPGLVLDVGEDPFEIHLGGKERVRS